MAYHLRKFQVYNAVLSALGTMLGSRSPELFFLSSFFFFLHYWNFVHFGHQLPHFCLPPAGQSSHYLLSATMYSTSSQVRTYCLSVSRHDFYKHTNTALITQLRVGSLRFCPVVYRMKSKDLSLTCSILHSLLQHAFLLMWHVHWTHDSKFIENIPVPMKSSADLCSWSNICTLWCSHFSLWF